MNWRQIAEKKFFNIPVLYWGLAAAVLMLVIALRMKPTIDTTPDDTTASDPTTDGGLNDPTTADYDGLLPSGTVVVAPQPKPATDVVEQTNTSWSTGALKYLISAEGGNAVPTEAQTALSLYLNGGELSIQQNDLVNRAIKKLGPPPEPLGTIGTVTPPAQSPAQKQFSTFPGKHTVKGDNDNTALKLATLYYGSGKAKLGVPKIGQYNEQYGPASSVVYRTGDVIFIPGWEEPRYYTVTSTTRYPAKIAATMPAGTRTAADIEQLNPGQAWPANVGAKIRIV